MYVSSRELSETQEIPYQFLRRIVRNLARKGLVRTKEGSGGGAELAVHPSEIKVADVIRIFQGEIEISECVFRKKICSNRQTCVLRHEIKRIENLVTREFEKLTIEKLVDKAKEPDCV
jgi:Rrf2 family protein